MLDSVSIALSGIPNVDTSDRMKCMSRRAGTRAVLMLGGRDGLWDGRSRRLEYSWMLEIASMHIATRREERGRS